MVLPIAIYYRTAQIAIVACTVSFGIAWVAAGQIGLGCISLFINTRYLRRCANVRLSGLLRAARPSLVVTALTVVLPLALLARPGSEAASPWLSLILGGGLGGVCWIGAIIGLNHPLSQELLALFHEMLRLVRRAV
jgi:hypothetical protein